MFIRNLILYPLLESEGGSGGGEEQVDELSQDLADLGDSDEEGKEGDDEEEESEEAEESDEIREKGKKGKKKLAAKDEEDDEEIIEDDEDEEGDEDEGEDEEEDDEESEKELERDVTGRPTVKAIKSKYPEIFKDFPELRRAYFTLPRYEEFFADPQQAAEAVEKSREYDGLESSLVGKGDPTDLIKTLAENNPRALKKLIQNFPGSVRDNFNEAYIELAKPILEELVYMAFKHGEKTGNKNLQLSARHVANFIWSNGGDIPDITKRDVQQQPSEAEKELENERARNARDKFTSAVKEIAPQAEEALRGILSQNLNGLTKFERKSVIKDARAEIDMRL